MKFELFDLFIKQTETLDVQVIIMYRLNKKHVIEVTFRGEPETVRQWLAETANDDDVLFMEIRKLYDITTVVSYGVPYNGEIVKVERNSLELELEHLSYE